MISVPSLSTAKDALALLSQITDLTKAAMTIELKEKIVELRETLLAQKEEALNLRAQNSELQKKIDLRDQLEFEQPNYILRKPDGSQDGPFCQVCYDKDSKLIRLKSIETGSWNCGCCNQHFETADRHRRSMEALNHHITRQPGDWGL